jgi:uncharacterized protein (TIGR02246 family)
MRRILLIAVLAIAGPSFLSGQQGDRTIPAAGTEQEIKEVINQVREAQLKGDAAALNRFLADEYTFTNPFGEVLNKSETISEHTSGALKFHTMNMDDVRLQVYGDAAVATSQVTIKGQRGGHDISGRYRATWMLVKDEARWQPVAVQSTRIADETSEARPVEE